MGTHTPTSQTGTRASPTRSTVSDGSKDAHGRSIFRRVVPAKAAVSTCDGLDPRQDPGIRTDTATTRRFRLNGPSRISTAFCLVGANYLVTESLGRKFSTLDAYVNERLAILASAERGAKADTGSHASNFEWVNQLGVYSLNGTVKPYACVCQPSERCRRPARRGTACTVRCGGGGHPDQSAVPRSPLSSSRPYRTDVDTPLLLRCLLGQKEQTSRRCDLRDSRLAIR